MLNDYVIINLAMQVINEHDWPERSLNYLCRSFDNLHKGEDYCEVRPVIQIAFLDFTLFPEKPEFYATYQLLNIKNHTIYSDKLRLSVLDLTHISLATEEDKQYQIDYWASLFKATTWEELKMLAEKNESIAEATETIYKLSQEEMIRLQCEAREDYYRRERSIQRQMRELTTTNKELILEKQRLTAENEQLVAEIARLRAQLDSI